ncbi:hypothetical protein [Flavivirga jejuensis]|uniref:Carboxypeptidase-like protein n=1 Tax=Flavivirga jejuensis TaxID=870487 RepID=A0ABT8WUP8_9FLAO|nr:hypothetical protein [Flavivirga jejuensis]MDO5976814.1 hypothetical protein [Flavivirga jejuensis]
MLKIKLYSTILSLFCFQGVLSQTVEIFGKVESKSDIENIHVINKTAQVFTITNKDGEFNMDANLNDTLVFSSIQHKLKEVVVSKNVISTKVILVTLDEQVNELDEVVVGKVLTGNIFMDIKNMEGKPPVNFFDLGIPGYTGKLATQSERRLDEARGGGIKWYQPLTGSVPLNPILNAISGRTKMLKNRVEIETKEPLMQSIKSRLSKDFLASNPLEENLVADFFYFCADDENFIKRCKNQTDFNILVFLRYKYRQYMENLEEGKD